MKKKTNLDLGILILYDWRPAFEQLSGKEAKALLLALMDRQQLDRPFPPFGNAKTATFARMIEPVIRRRLEGAAAAKKGATEESAPSGDPTEVPARKRRENIKKSQEKISEAELRGEDAPPSPPAALRALSEEERSLLMEEGLPAAYIDAREVRALEFADKSGQDVLSVLCSWWKQDKKSYHRPQKQVEQGAESSFDVDEFWEASLARAYSEDSPLKRSISPITG